MKKTMVVVGMLALCFALFGCGSQGGYTVLEFDGYSIEVPNGWEKDELGGGSVEIYSAPDSKASVSIENQATDITGLSLDEQYLALRTSPEVAEGAYDDVEQTTVGDRAALKAKYNLGEIQGIDLIFFASDTERVSITTALLEGADSQDTIAIDHVLNSIQIK